MARFLIGWELGGGHGHAVNMVALGRELIARGHQVFFAARDVAGIWPVTRSTGIPVLQAPAYAGAAHALTGGKPFHARRFSDVLAVFGYGDPAVLEPQVRGWDALLATVQPDVVVSEFAPTLCLAAYGRLPTLAFGIGYCLPCLAADTFPLLDARATTLLPDAALRAGIATVLHRLGRAVPVDPFAALLGDQQLMISMDEIDPYRSARQQAALGPLLSLSPLPSAPLAPYCVVYLPADHPRIGAIAQNLVTLDMPGIVYVRGAGAPLLNLLRKTKLTVATTPIDLDLHLSQATVMLHHGGPGTVQRCLAAGVVQVVAPTVLEQNLVAQALVECGVGLRLGNDNAAQQSASSLLLRATQDAQLRQQARALAATVQAKYPAGSLQRVVDACIANIRPERSN